MEDKRIGRHIFIAWLLVVAAIWMFSTAGSRAGEATFPNAGLIATPQWLMEHGGNEKILIVDVRVKREGMVFIDGAVSIPWTLFRCNDEARGIAGVFVGLARAQEILGSHGVARDHAIILYDSVDADGGATASYVFWVLDILGHRNVKILERGIDGWVAAGGAISSSTRTLPSLRYQAPRKEIRLRLSQNGDFIAKRLGDPHYQILDSRSAEEYLGRKPNIGLDGNILELGHIPTAVNVDYRLNWNNPLEKAIRPYHELLTVYRGLDPAKAVIVYCHSGRRSSFSYYILKAMGFQDVILYEMSWNEWGQPDNYYPTETRENKIAGHGLPLVKGGRRSRPTGSAIMDRTEPLEPIQGGYVSDDLEKR